MWRELFLSKCLWDENEDLCPEVVAFHCAHVVFVQDSKLVAGVAFKKTFSYAGFEMQPKKYKNPKIALLNIELELKSERDNAEIRVDSVEVGYRHWIFRPFKVHNVCVGIARCVSSSVDCEVSNLRRSTSQ